MRIIIRNYGSWVMRTARDGNGANPEDITVMIERLVSSESTHAAGSIRTVVKNLIAKLSDKEALQDCGSSPVAISGC